MDVQKGDNHDIDRIIRQKMNHLRPEFRPGSWDQLAERLDQVETDDAFDAEISGRLQRMRVPYRESSWAALAERLELEKQRIQAVAHYKIMEVSLLLLLFITAWQHLPQQETKPALPPGIPIAALDGSNEQASSTSKALNITATGNSENTSEHYLSSTEALPEGASSDADTDLQTDTDPSGTKTKKSNTLDELSNWPVSSMRSDGPIDPLTNNLEKATIAYQQPDAQVQFKTFMAQKAERLSSPSDAFASAGALAALEGTATPLLDYGNPDELLDFIRPLEQKTFVRIGFVGSPDYNRVITPSQDVDGNGTVAPSIDRYSLGYGGGITIGVEHGRWEIETGAIYAARRYQAIPAVYISGNLREGYSGVGLTDFELNTVSAPLNLRYNFVLHDKWRLYAQGGASLNIVLGANYYLADQAEFAGLQRNPAGGNGGSPDTEKPAPLREKSLTDGWFEGGSFWDNATMYADFGVGLERYMSPHWSMFVQPTYRHALPLFNEGLGPYQDRIHNFGIGMGLKVRL